jgi:hypothetical protein
MRPDSFRMTVFLAVAVGWMTAGMTAWGSVLQSGSVSAAPGDTVLVDFALKGSSVEAVALSFHLPQPLRLLSVRAGDPSKGIFMYSSDAVADGTRVSMLYLMDNGLIGSGVWSTLEVEIPRDAAPGTYRLTSVAPEEGSGLIMPAASSSSLAGMIGIDLGLELGSIVVQADGDADIDGDGLPDAWEIECFGNLSHSWNGDFDGDGCSNGEECIAGTDPASAFSFLKLALERHPLFGIALRWTPAAGRVYQVERAEPGGPWLPMTEIVTDDDAEIVLPTPMHAPSAQYRLIVTIAVE